MKKYRIYWRSQGSICVSAEDARDAEDKFWENAEDDNKTIETIEEDNE